MEPENALPTVLITGANRGLGLEFARQFAGRGWRVIATCRNPHGATDLQVLIEEGLPLQLAALDVTDHAAADRLAGEYAGVAIDLLLLNSALLGPQAAQRLGHFDFRLFDQSFAANATGPLKVVEAFLPHVRAGVQKKIVFLGSAAGSIALLRPPANLYAYRASKAALHLLARNLALDLAPQGIRVGLVNPGLADTRGLLKLGPQDEPPPDLAPVMALVRAGVVRLITPQEAVRGMIEVIDNLSEHNSGQFLNYDGAVLPW